MRNRRKPIYGECDGNPMSLDDLQNLDPAIEKTHLERLVKLRILKHFEGNKYEFKNRRLSGGIDGVYRVYVPTSRDRPTLTATGMRDAVATVDVDGDTDEDIVRILSGIFSAPESSAQSQAGKRLVFKGSLIPISSQRMSPLPTVLLVMLCLQMWFMQSHQK